MKRLHIHLSVQDLSSSISFYSKLFAASPTVVKEDYAKWMVEDPYVNFAISTRTGKSGLEHFGIQVDSEEELQSMRTQLQQENLSVKEEGKTVCCYMHSDKSWIQDPDSFPWEIYQSMEEAQYFSSNEKNQSDSACCSPSLQSIGKGCC